MLTNLKCHLQFLEIYLLCTLCHIACISVLTKPVFGLIERDGEWRMLNALFEGRILFLALLTHSRSRVIQNVRVIAVYKNVTRQLKAIILFFLPFNLKLKYTHKWHFIFFYFFFTVQINHFCPLQLQLKLYLHLYFTLPLWRTKCSNVLKVLTLKMTI